MAVANRYSRFSPARYTPFTLQEMMLAPAYMREQHDALTASGAELQAGIAQVNPLGVHTDAAAAEQKRLNDMINQQVDMLQKEGFNPASKNQFIRLNKEYQSAISPTGVLGKINSAKAAYDLEKEASIAGLIEQGWSPELAAQKWLEHSANYSQEFQNTNEIKNIERLYGPQKVDYLNEFTQYAQAAGVDATDILRGDGAIERDETGSWVVNWEDRNATESNAKQLQGLVDFMNLRMFSPDGDIYRTLEYMGKSPETAMQEIQALQKAYTRSSTVDHYTRSLNSFNAAEVDNPLDGNGIVATNRAYNLPKHATDYSKVVDELEELRANPDRTADDEIRIGNLERYQAEINEQLKQLGDGEGYKLVEDVEYLKQQIKDLENISFGSGNPTYDRYYKSNMARLKRNKPGLSDAEYEFLNKRETDSQYKSKLTGDLEAINNKLKPYLKEVATDMRLMNDSYTITPRTPKQKNILKTANENFARIFGSATEAMAQAADIIRVTDINNKVIEGLSPRDKSEISELAFRAVNEGGNDAIELVEFTPRDANGLPSYVVRVKTTDKYDLDQIGRDYTGGEDGSMLVTLNFKEGALGAIKNVNGYLGEYLAMSGNEGLEVAAAMDYSLTENAVRTRFLTKTWEDAISEIGLQDKAGRPTPVGMVYGAELAQMARDRFGKSLTQLTTAEINQLESDLKTTQIR